MPGHFDERIKSLRLLVLEAGESAQTAEVLKAHGFYDVLSCETMDQCAALLRDSVRKRRLVAAAIIDWELYRESGAKPVAASLPALTGPAFALVNEDLRGEDRRPMVRAGFAGYVPRDAEGRIVAVRIETLLLRHYLSSQVRRGDRHNQHLFLNILQLMAKVLEAKDPYTKFHSEGVATQAYRIAQQLGYDEDQLEKIAMAGILHDFGKIGVREDILNKPGTLTADEYKQVQRHPLIASTILEPIEELRDIIGDIRHHHENWDGTGYPTGLAGEKIPLGARILHVAEAFDTMTADRAYHKARSSNAARTEICERAGSQFDPRIVRIFTQLLEEERGAEEPSESELETSSLPQPVDPHEAQATIMNVLTRKSKQLLQESEQRIVLPDEEDLDT